MPPHNHTAALLRVSDPATLLRLRDALKRCEGVARAAALELGIHPVTLSRIGNDIPAVREILDRHGLSPSELGARANSARQAKEKLAENVSVLDE